MSRRFLQPVLYSTVRIALKLSHTVAPPRFIYKRYCPQYATTVMGPLFGSKVHARERHGTAVEPPDLQRQQQQLPEPGGGEHEGGENLGKTAGGSSGATSSSVAPSPPPPATIGSPSNIATSSLSDSPAPPPPPSTPLPPASHLFDTYTLVNRLSPPFSREQSIALMHLIRSLLTQYLSRAESNLLSRSTFENSAYLFRAASAELRSEISTLRASQLEKMRTERAQVQREFELLNGRFMEELMVCGNELRGMFDDRKMVTRVEQREVENKIQELNYKITVTMGSDLKSEVEKLRWVTTRRGLIAIGLLAGRLAFSLQKSNSCESRDTDKNLYMNDHTAFIVSLIKLSQNIHKRTAVAHEHELSQNDNGLWPSHGSAHVAHGGNHMPGDGLIHTATIIT